PACAPVVPYTTLFRSRHYGALQGKDKKRTMEEYGEEQFMLWRRSYDTPPPRIEAGSEYSQDADPRYADLAEANPMTECLADVVRSEEHTSELQSRLDL